MNGLGNDFVVLDARDQRIDLNSNQIQKICHRNIGVGCDQLIILEVAEAKTDVRMRIYNADGGEVEACGNAARCIGRFIMDEKGSSSALIETLAGLLTAKKVKDGIEIDMGPVYLEWQNIPLSEAMDTLSLDITEGPLTKPVAVGVGNPHAIFFVEDLTKIKLEKIGPIIEQHHFFPNRTNVNVAQVLSLEKIRLQTWERGVGMTQACGTGACATLVAAARRELTKRKASIELVGGVLEIEWRNDNHVLMSGPIEINQSGIWTF